MPELRILPGDIADLIAAGEVVQRPASVVKEMMENSVDAGASRVDVIVKDAGRTLIQIIDDGCGMTPDDAVLCFERHATSKIATAEDLQAIRTYGFRGEASLDCGGSARDPENQDGRSGDRMPDGLRRILHLNTSETACPKGSNFLVRDLFYNVPAREEIPEIGQGRAQAPSSKSSRGSP